MKRGEDAERQENSQTIGDNGEVLTGSLQSRQKHDKMESLEDAGPAPIETAEAVKNFNRIDGEHSRKEDCEKVNPNFYDDVKWRNNCQRCCAGFEARRRGFDVTAKPLVGSPYEDDYARGMMGYTKFYQTGGRVPENVYRKLGYDRSSLTLDQVKEGIETIMDEYGNGSRAIINGFWESNDEGHVFIAENVGGKVHFYDPQIGEMNYTRPFEAMQPRSMMIFRVDDLPFSEDVRNAVSNYD